MTGVQAHIGSQILEAGPLVETARALSSLARELAAAGFPIETVDIGGGIGIGPGALTPEAYAKNVRPALEGLPGRLLVEPGRAIVGPAGALVTRVLGIKCERAKTFVVVDAAMNDLLRPALYEAHHPIERVREDGGERITADIVGPVCETADCFLHDAEIPRPEEGDLVAILDAGAYGSAMSSNYNFRPRAAEVLVESGASRLVRRRETYDDLVRLERA